ncbi:MAG: DUF4097 domain-containing protein [Actinobacteria bacterium]|nr:DUF4097 domain-containing protein [Actinomycetota bacterium]
MRKFLHKCSILLCVGLFVTSTLSGCFVAHASLANSRSFELDDVTYVSLEYGIENISIFASDTDEMVIKEYLSEDDSAYFAQVTQNETGIVIEQGERHTGDPFDAYIEVYLPLTYEGALRIKTTSGSIRIEPTFTFDTLGISTTGGPVNIGTVSAESLSVDTDAGRVDISGVTGHVRCGSNTGSIKIGSLQGSGTFFTTSGKIDVDFDSIEGDLKATSTSGKIELGIPNESYWSFVASSIDGYIRVPFDDELILPSDDSTVDGSTETQEKEKTSVLEASRGLHPEHSIILTTDSGTISVHYL